MKKFFVIAGSIGLIGILVAYSIVWATTPTATVTATVMVRQIALSVTDGIVTYGILDHNATRSTCTGAGELNDLQTVTNTGNAAQTFNIQGHNTDWTLGSTAGPNIYVHRFVNAICTTFSAGTALTTTYQTLATNIAPAGTTPLNLQINTPNPSTVFTVQSVNVTIQAVAF